MGGDASRVVGRLRNQFTVLFAEAGCIVAPVRLVLMESNAPHYLDLRGAAQTRSSLMSRNLREPPCCTRKGVS